MADIPCRIEHVGSTAVPDLAAKPTIDIIIVIPDMSVFPEVVNALGTLGYQHFGDQDVRGREVFKKTTTAPQEHGQEQTSPAHHLYVCPEGSESLEHMIRFRDYLRTHRRARRRYASLKKRLARKYRNDRVAYTEAKTGFVMSILESAGK
jgi:GrpB-like predicted nucleotidyltransferase (UPF0157 family)